MPHDFYDYPDLYDALFPLGAHLTLYSDLARQHGPRVLELACGTGLLTVPMAGIASGIVGLDRSAAMLASARTRAARSGAHCEFVEGDMRHFALGRTFDLIFIARNSLLHVLTTEDLLSTFASVRSHLAPGGMFAFDVFNPYPSILARPAGQRFPIMQIQDTQFGQLTVEGTHRYEMDRQVDDGTWYISTDSERDKWVVSVVVRSIFPQELPLLLQAGGLTLIDRFGDLSRRPFGGGSPQQVCLCRAAA